MRDTGLESVTVIGCGVIGTSVALALRRRGVRVRLHDRDRATVREAALRGAGSPLKPGDPPADVVVVATTPASVVAVLRDAQERGLGAAYTDVASAKSRIVADAEAAGCDMRTYVPGHPMAGRELSGPAAACAELFTGRRWALCPVKGTSVTALSAVLDLVDACHGRPLLLTPGGHDEAVAAVSHVPHLVASALAARFTDADGDTLRMVGQGLKDVTRIATGSPLLWREIVEQNGLPVASVLEAVAGDLAALAAALRRPGADLDDVLTGLLTRGEDGRARLVAQAAPAAA